VRELKLKRRHSNGELLRRRRVTPNHALAVCQQECDRYRFLLLAKNYLTSCVPQVAMYITFLEHVIPVSAGIAEYVLDKARAGHDSPQTGDSIVLTCPS
jgi:hypothetical protein